MTQLRHDRVFSLADSNAYPGNPWLDRLVFLPSTEDPRRRIWLMAPAGEPRLTIDRVSCSPGRAASGEPRWLDYGVVELPFLTVENWSGGDFVQVRLEGLGAVAARDAHLVISRDLDLDLGGCSLPEAERRLWGLAREDAGATTLQPARVPVGRAATFTVTYTAGPRGLPAGAGVLFTLPKLFSRPQTERPDEPGFTSVTAADAPVRIDRIENSVESHAKVDVICRLEEPLPQGSRFSLQYHTDRTYIFSRRYMQTDRPWWYALQPPLAAAVSPGPGRPFVSLAEANGHTLSFEAGPAERLHLFLPGRRRSGEGLWLRGTFTDHYRNSPPGGPLPAGIRLWLERGDEQIPLGTPEKRFVSRHRFALPLPDLPPGVYRAYAAKDETGDLLAASNPLEITSPGDHREEVYWGEIHTHTEMSDGSGEYGELFRHAREEGCLDFTAAADHAVNFTDNQWAWMQDLTNAWNEPGRFVTLVGYEWGGRQMHRNVYTARDHLALVRGRMLPTSEVSDLWSRYHGDDQVVGGGHSSLGHGMVWDGHDPAVERFIEIYAMWGASDFRDSPLAPPWIQSEAFGEKAGANLNWRPDNPRFIPVNEILKTGARLGFTGGGDCHEARPGFSAEDPDGQGTTPQSHSWLIRYRCGMTAALAESLDRKSLIRALRERRTYATTGARILLDFSVSDLPMGSAGKAGEAVCRVAIHADSELQEAQIIRDGRVVHVEPLEGLDAQWTWRDPDPPVSESYYYLHVIQQDGQRAWSSPVWVAGL